MAKSKKKVKTPPKPFEEGWDPEAELLANYRKQEEDAMKAHKSSILIWKKKYYGEAAKRREESKLNLSPISEEERIKHDIELEAMLNGTNQ